MGKYHYDESGNMASMFVLTFLAIVLVPLSLSFSPFSREKKVSHGCQCGPCQEQRANIRKREQTSLLNPKVGAKSGATILGWILFAFLTYRVANSTFEAKVYNPFEILGLRSSSTEKEIRSHYKKLSRQYHPDKVKLVGNDTMETAAARFVDFTKAYKALTDETIRENLVKYGHPDGAQETTMGIALPPWIVEGHNNIWVLGVYGLLFGIGLPIFVGRWWFGSQSRTKDGVRSSTAASFFKSIKEDSSVPDIVSALSKAAEWGTADAKVSAHQEQLEALDEQIQAQLGSGWTDIRRLAETSGDAHRDRKRALVLLYAHLLRIPVADAELRKEQTAAILQTPALLNALLQITLGRNWLAPSVTIMRLCAYFAQALPPRKGHDFAQLPGVSVDDAKALKAEVDGLKDVAERLSEKNDSRAEDVKKALAKWNRLELVDVAFKVIDERIVTPASIVYLVVKLRLRSPTASASSDVVEEETVDAAKQRIKQNDKKDYAFLTNPKADAEDVAVDESATGWAHAPFWPAHRKAGWWLLIADDKLNRVVVPPLKISEIPFSTGKDRDYRSYKLQFQAPQGVGVYTWKLYIVSDTFVGEGVEYNITLNVEDPATLNEDERGIEDEISDPEEDSLAGQMAALRGGSVKIAGAEGDEESDDESGTDDDEESDSDSSSDDD